MKSDRLPLGEIDILTQPTLIAEQLRSRGQRAVGHHRQDSSLKRHTPVLSTQRLLQDPPDPQALPQDTEQIEGAILPTVNKLPARLHLSNRPQGAMTPNTGCQLSEPLLHLAIGPAQWADDPGLRTPLVRVPGVLGDLVYQFWIFDIPRGNDATITNDLCR